MNFTARSTTLILYDMYSAYSLIWTRLVRFYCKHVRITKILDKYKKSIFLYNSITAAYNAMHNKSIMVKTNT